MQRLDLEQQPATSSSSIDGGRKSHAKFWEVALEGLQTVPWQHRPLLWLKVGHRDTACIALVGWFVRGWLRPCTLSLLSPVKACARLALDVYPPCAKTY